MIDRRDFTASLLGSITSYSLLEMLFTREAFAGPIRSLTDHWVKELHVMSLDLKSDRLTPSRWQSKVQELFDKVPLPEMLKFVNFERLKKGFMYPEQGVNTRPVPFPKLAGLPSDLVFHRKLFGMKKDRAIIPHGHNNMVSCHYVLQGALHLKHYDKLEEDQQYMVITPTTDLIARPGSHSSISDEKNNIHWLKAVTETAFTLDVLVLDLKGKPYNVDNIDPAGAERLRGDRLRVKKLGLAEALRKYGHDMHH
jgi:hypothetical protein